MSEHEERADELEREADEMQKRSDKLESDIDDARQDWERKKADPGVPGAAGDPSKAHDGPEPETSYPAKGDSD
jgi:hypothetical protein